MKRIQIHFIVNPVAGHGNTMLNRSYLAPFFNKNEYHIKVKQTAYKNHAKSLTIESINENPDIIVACGGDGTINEVASCLVNTKILLGIIPIGSGNGLASSLNIPRNIYEAIKLIKTQKINMIDVGKLNNNYFFSNCGIGFDAQVIKTFENNTKRRLSGYLEAIVKAIKNFNPLNNVQIEINEQTFNLNPFLIFSSNSNEMGYHFSLTPNASLKDGLLDVLIIPHINIFKIIFLGVLMLFNRPEYLKEATFFQTRKLKISQPHESSFQTQVDGEYIHINNSSLTISLIQKSLLVIA